MLTNWKTINIDPFTNTQMDLYSCITFKNYVRKLHRNLASNAIKELKDQKISSITWLSKIEEDSEFGNYEDIFNALENHGDTTFKSNFRIEKLLNSDNDLYAFASSPGLMDRCYLVPHVLEHFDIRGVNDFKVLNELAMYKAINLGFNLLYESTGNAEQQRLRCQDNVKVIMFRCLQMEQQREAIRELET